MDIDYARIGQNVKHYREERNMTQATLAEMIGKSAQHVSNIECNKTKLSFDSFMSIAKALDVDMRELYGIQLDQLPLDRELIELFRHATPKQQRNGMKLFCEYLKLESDD